MSSQLRDALELDAIWCKQYAAHVSVADVDSKASVTSVASQSICRVWMTSPPSSLCCTPKWRSAAGATTVQWTALCGQKSRRSSHTADPPCSAGITAELPLMLFSTDTDVLVLVIANYDPLLRNTIVQVHVQPIWTAHSPEKAKAVFQGADNTGRLSC